MASSRAMSALTFIPEDLAPGDRRACEAGSHLRAQLVRDPGDPLFDRLYQRLWHEFGHRNEMERRDVIVDRLARDPRDLAHGHALLYELLAILDGDEVVGLRDHTAIVPPRDAMDASTRVLVHLSHVIVEPPHRGTGLSGWLRALPLQTARACAAAVGRRCDAITLVGEMEHPDDAPDVQARLRSYDRAGFRKLDPRQVPYHQPDFRPASEIDASAPRPVPLMLSLRRVGREHERSVPAAEVRELVTGLYTLFAVHQRAEHMAPLWALRDALPRTGAVPLLPLLA